MANQRLLAALRQAGLDQDQLAELVKVDVKSVGRWLAGTTTPYARHRAKVAKALGVSERELWPQTAIEIPAEDPRREIQGAWPHANDLRAPDWRTMMRDAAEQIDLLGFSLIDIVAAAGVTSQLAAKAASGCTVRVLIAAPDSIWVDSVAKQLDQDDEDYVSRNELAREIELARGHLETLIDKPGVAVHAFYAERYNTILRFDEHMLVMLHLWGTPASQAPLLHVHRRSEDGLFDQFAAHFDAILQEASQPLEPDRDAYPDPAKDPDRYRPMTKERYEQQTRAAQLRSRQTLSAEEHTLEQVRGELQQSLRGQERQQSPADSDQESA